MSQEEKTDLIVQELRDANVKLNQIWNQVQMDEQMRLTRISSAYDNIKKYIKNIVDSEKEMVDGVLYDINKRRETTQELRRLFGMPPFCERAYPANSIALLKALDKDVNALRVRKQAIIEKQVNVYKYYVSLCRRTGIPHKEIDGILDEILNEKVVRDLEGTASELEEVLAERILELSSIQAEDKKILDTLSGHVNITAEETDLLNVDLNDSGFVISDEVVEDYKMLDQKLKNFYDDWIEQVAFQYDELIVKMNELSKKCNTDLSSKYPPSFDPSRQSTESIHALEADVRALEEKYERGRPVFDKLNEWMTLWSEKLNVERRVCRTSFYKNRGGTLNSTLKRQKQVQQQVPKVYAELERMVAEFRSKYNPEDILIDGMMPDEYAKSVEAAYHYDKEMQKVQKQFSKKGKENAAVNAKTITDKTRTLMGRSAFKTPAISPAPSSSVRTGVTPLRQGMPSRKRSFSCSELSCISPTKPPLRMYEPMTSSPKVNNNDLTSRRPVTPRKPLGMTPKVRAVTPRAVTPTHHSRPWY